MMRMSVEAKVVRRSGSASQRTLAREVDSGQQRRRRAKRRESRQGGEATPS